MRSESVSDHFVHTEEQQVVHAKGSKSAPVGVVSKVLRIFEILHGVPEGMHLRDIAKQAAINKSTAYRFLAHLESEGYVFRDDEGAYTIGLKLARLGSGIAFHATLRKISRPVLQNLAHITNESINLGALDGQEVLYLDVMESPHSFRLVSQVGTRRPLYCTGLGKAMLAYLPEEEREYLLASMNFERFTPHTLIKLPSIRKEMVNTIRRGYALDDEEAVLGSRCVAAPILDARGKVFASISVSGPITRMDRNKTQLFGSTVRDAGRSISRRLGFAGA
jgi:IclR family KDG regulon transcriptional repressor